MKKKVITKNGIQKLIKEYIKDMNLPTNIGVNYDIEDDAGSKAKRLVRAALIKKFKEEEKMRPAIQQLGEGKHKYEEIEKKRHPFRKRIK